jgi:hypothetical protein
LRLGISTLAGPSSTDTGYVDKADARRGRAKAATGADLLR